MDFKLPLSQMYINIKCYVRQTRQIVTDNQNLIQSNMRSTVKKSIQRLDIAISTDRSHSTADDNVLH